MLQKWKKYTSATDSFFHPKTQVDYRHSKQDVILYDKNDVIYYCNTLEVYRYSTSGYSGEDPCNNEESSP